MAVGSTASAPTTCVRSIRHNMALLLLLLLLLLLHLHLNPLLLLLLPLLLRLRSRRLPRAKAPTICLFNG